MSKSFRFIDPVHPAPSISPPAQTNWKLCRLCQEDMAEPLRCPSQFKRRYVGSGHSSLAENLVRFSELGQLPPTLQLERLDEGNGIGAAMVANNAQYGHSWIDGLHEAATFQLDSWMQACATMLEDTKLLGQLSAGDMVALDSKSEGPNETGQEREASGIVLAELVLYIEETRVEEGRATVIKLADLAHLYQSRMEQLGFKFDTRVHSTRLKQRLLAHFPDMQAHNKGRNVLMIFEEDVGAAITKNCELDSDSDAVHLACAAQIVRCHMFGEAKPFNGFPQRCQEESVPSLLLALVNLVLEGPSINDQIADTSPAALTIAHLLKFNSIKHKRMCLLSKLASRPQHPQPRHWQQTSYSTLQKSTCGLAMPWRLLMAELRHKIIHHGQPFMPATRRQMFESSAPTPLLPLYVESAHTVAMIRHSIDVIKNAVEHLNTGQTPVVTLNQPLYALAKQIQWTWPERYGEDKLVVMFGGLHIEMAALKMLGDWLEGSGWVEALVQAKIATPGSANSFLRAAHVTRTKRTHQITAAALYVQQKRAYDHFCLREVDHTEYLPKFNAWCKKRKDTPLFQDMAELEKKHPDVAREFNVGNFAVQKTRKVFSSIPIDQAHEQNNACIKGDGGAVGLTINSSALSHWMVLGPEVVRVIEEFIDEHQYWSRQRDTHHYDQIPSVQTSIIKDAHSLVSVTLLRRKAWIWWPFTPRRLPVLLQLRLSEMRRALAKTSSRPSPEND
ncbi:hypothetical protein Hamer_G024212, partial [Homarus americanus]